MGGGGGGGGGSPASTFIQLLGSSPAITQLSRAPQNAGIPVSRLAPAAYGADNAPAGASRPSARRLSNRLAQPNIAVRERGSTAASNFFWVFGQFLVTLAHGACLTRWWLLQDHDIVLSHDVSPSEPFPISVPANDAVFSGFTQIDLERSDYVEINGQREQLNFITPAIDGSNVYGSDAAVTAQLREFQGGRLLVSDGDWPLAVDGSFVVGDVRGSEQPLLLGMHTVFLREHNRIAAELADAFPQMSDEQVHRGCFFETNLF